MPWCENICFDLVQSVSFEKSRLSVLPRQEIIKNNDMRAFFLSQIIIILFQMIQAFTELG